MVCVCRDVGVYYVLTRKENTGVLKFVEYNALCLMSPQFKLPRDELLILL